MAITHIATVHANGTTAAIDTTGASLIVIATSRLFAGGSVTDSKGNTWTALTQRTGSSLFHQQFYCLGPITGPGHTFTTTSGSFASLVVHAFAGVNAFHSQNGAGAASGTSLTVGSVTPSADGALIVTSLGLDTPSQSPTVAPGMTQTNHPFVGGTNVAVTTGWLVQTTAVAINPVWSWPSSTMNAGAVAVFLAGEIPIPPARTTQLAVETLSLPVPSGRASQLVVEVLGGTTSAAAASALVSQLAVETLQPSPPPTVASLTQLAVETLQAIPFPSVTQLAVELLTPSDPLPLRVTQLALEVYRSGLYGVRASQLAVEIYHPVLISARATQAAVEWLQARAARTRVSHAVVEVWTPPRPPTGGGSCPTPFFDPDLDEEWP